jgi:hypothetical protein
MEKVNTVPETGFVVIESVDVINNREVPNCDPAHEGNWSYEQGAYFPNGGLKSNDYYDDDD